MKLTLVVWVLPILLLSLLLLPVRGTTGALTITADTTLTEDHFGDIIILADGVTLNCAGHVVYGSGSVAGITLVGRTGVTVRNCDVTDFGIGFELSSSSGNTLMKNTASNNRYGYRIGVFSSENTLQDNTAKGNGFAGFQLLHSSSQNTLRDNTADSNVYGFHLTGSSGNVLQDNTADNNVYGFHLTGSPGNVLRGNRADNSGLDGFHLRTSTGNTLQENAASNSINVGFYLMSSFGNTLHRNRIISSTVHAFDSSPADNHWHHPELLEGNFWSDYPGVDDGSGAGKHSIAGDGIGDTHIPWPGPDLDCFPLVDNEQPATTASLSGTAGQRGWFTSSVLIALGALDNVSGVSSISYRVDIGPWQTYTGPLPVDGDGVHTLEYFSTDYAGNVESVQSVEIRIDEMGPETSAVLDGTLGVNGWYISTVSVMLTAADSTSGVASISYRLDSGPWQGYTDPFTLSDGVNTVEYFSMDNAANREHTNPLHVKIDTTRPEFASTSPSGTVTASDLIVSWTANDAISGISHYEVSVDGAPFRSVGLATSTLVSVSDGDHSILVRAIDAAGNLGEEEIRFRVDTNILSPSGPYAGIPLYVLVGVVLGIAFLLLWRSRGSRGGKGTEGESETELEPRNPYT